MSEDNKLLHRLAIDLKRDIEDIKDNMSMAEFLEWKEYYKSETTLETISMQLARVSEMLHTINFQGDVTIYDFLPTSTQEQKEKAKELYKSKKINDALVETFGE